ncbi:toll/interleukin-1 receptor domain-containing protein [Luteibacter sp. 9133]|uniref:toll/interleukin-1 receptor domain-containing protein n=1 Tax=Luteibacter sp. 9133 TaxID=1500891 RepID=UPI0005BC0A3B|nr:toll/interleukin-1 receptor domain-containing protein [Luteibacter sp. 9133]
MPSVFFSYSHVDEALRDRLEVHLAMLKRQGVIATWHDRRIGAGENIHHAIDERINHDDIILLLVSPDFLASTYCYDIEVKRAMERHRAEEAIVIPVILRPSDWHEAPFGDLNAVPKDGKAVTRMPDADEAFLEIAGAIRDAAKRWGRRATPAPATSPAPTPEPSLTPSSATDGLRRSSNLRVAKGFTQLDKERFRLETFEFIANFFENSLTELADRNDGIDVLFRRIDAVRFVATVFRHGANVAQCTVFASGGRGFGHGIYYVNGESLDQGSHNESLSVDADDHALYISALGMQDFGTQRGQKLTQEGAAEHLWELLLRPLQGRAS